MAVLTPPSLLRRILTAPFFVARETLEVADRLLIQIPSIHFNAFWRKPSFSNAFRIFMLGPVVGASVFLLNPKSFITGITIGAISAFVFPVLSFSALIGVGMVANLLTGVVQSQIVRHQNQKALAPHWEEWKKERDGNDGGQRIGLLMGEVINERNKRIQAGFFGPLPRALYYNFRAANWITARGRPYPAPEAMVMPFTGFAPRKPC